MSDNNNNDGRSEMEIVDSILDNVRVPEEYRDAERERERNPRPSAAVDTPQQDAIPGPDVPGPLAELADIMQHTTAARAVDFWAIYEHGLSRRGWGDVTNRNRETVSRNVSHAEDDLSDALGNFDDAVE